MSIEMKLAGKLQDRIIDDDINALHRSGVEPFTHDASPHYLAWIRQDQVLVVSLLNTIAGYARFSLILLAIITAIVVYRFFH